MSSQHFKGNKMSFRITGLCPKQFSHLYGLSTEKLKSQGVVRIIADTKPGYPDRIEMRDAMPGETLLLLNFMHQPVNSPYRASHAIYILEGAETRYDHLDKVPEVMASRILSVRAFDDAGLMVQADVVDGKNAEALFNSMLSSPEVSYLHVHNAKQGCYSGRVDRV